MTVLGRGETYQRPRSNSRTFIRQNAPAISMAGTFHLEFDPALAAAAALVAVVTVNVAAVVGRSEKLGGELGKTFVIVVTGGLNKELTGTLLPPPPNPLVDDDAGETPAGVLPGEVVGAVACGAELIGGVAGGGWEGGEGCWETEADGVVAEAIMLVVGLPEAGAENVLHEMHVNFS